MLIIYFTVNRWGAVISFHFLVPAVFSVLHHSSTIITFDLFCFSRNGQFNHKTSPIPKTAVRRAFNLRRVFRCSAMHQLKLYYFLHLMVKNGLFSSIIGKNIFYGWFNKQEDIMCREKFHQVQTSWNYTRSFLGQTSHMHVSDGVP